MEFSIAKLLAKNWILNRFLESPPDEAVSRVPADGFNPTCRQWVREKVETLCSTDYKRLAAIKRLPNI